MTVCRLKALCLLLPGLFVVLAATADTANPYQNIVDRNVFVLKPIPPPPPPPEPPKPPAPPVVLNGITTILGNKRALLSYSTTPKPGEPAKMMSMVLAEHEGGDVQVLEIDDKGGSVRVNAFGTVSTLTFKENGAKLPSGPAPSAPVANMPPPASGSPTPFAPPGGNGMNKTIPGRTLRLPTAPSGGQPGLGGQGGQAGVTPTGGTIDPQALGGFGQTARSAVPPEPNLTPEQDTILTELDRERHRNDPSYPPLPPTPMTSQQDMNAIMAPGWQNTMKGHGQAPQ